MQVPRQMAAVEHVDLYGPADSIFQRFGQLAKADLIHKIFDCYPVRKVSHWDWFSDNKEECKATRRVPNNKRRHDSVVEDRQRGRVCTCTLCVVVSKWSK